MSGLQVRAADGQVHHLHGEPALAAEAGPLDPAGRRAAVLYVLRNIWNSISISSPSILSYGPTQPEDPSPGRVLLEPSAGKPGTGTPPRVSPPSREAGFLLAGEAADLCARDVQMVVSRIRLAERVQLGPGRPGRRRGPAGRQARHAGRVAEDLLVHLRRGREGRFSSSLCLGVRG